MKNALVVATLVILFGGCATSGGNIRIPADIPIPRDVEIRTNPDLPPEINAFSGIWAGQWPGGAEVIVIVESLGRLGAGVVYGIGPAPQLGIPKGWSMRVLGDFDEEGILQLKLGTSGTRVDLKRPRNGVLTATYNRGGWSTDTVLWRIPDEKAKIYSSSGTPKGS